MTLNIITESQKGDKDATLMLIKKFNPLLKKYAGKLNYEDAYDDLVIEFLQILHDMQIDHIRNKNEGIIISYIAACLHSSYVKLLIKIQHIHNFILYSELSDEELYNIESKTAINDSYSDDDISYIKAVLTNPETQIILYIYFKQYTVAEIAKLYGVSRQAINQTKTRALKKLKYLVSDSSIVR